jgi:hypothetical protein
MPPLGGPQLQAFVLPKVTSSKIHPLRVIFWHSALVPTKGTQTVFAGQLGLRWRWFGLLGFRAGFA